MKLYKFNIHTNDGIATVVAQTKLDAYEIALGIWTEKYSLRVLSFFNIAHTGSIFEAPLFRPWNIPVPTHT